MIRNMTYSSLKTWQMKELGSKLLRIIKQPQALSKAKSTSSTLSDVVKDHFPHATVLPRLPVPTLQQTLTKYLRTVKPLISDEEYSVTEKLVKDFQNNDGTKLHALLEERAKHEENWLSDWWLDVGYLSSRIPLPVHMSPAMIGPLQSFKGQDGQLEFAAKMITAILDYKIMIDNKTVPLDMQGKKLLDMSQYYKIFSTCRIPGLSTDSLVYHSEDEKPPTHIIVARNNHFFKVCVYGNDGKPLNESQILAQLKMVVEQSIHPKSPIGVLTTSARKTWAEAYQRLSKGKINKSSLREIQRSMFMVCLDKKVPNPTALNKETDGALQLLHGYGAEKGNSGNRWFDKTLQFIIGQDGIFGVCYEHSPAEGPPVANIVDHIDNRMNKKSEKYLPSSDTISPSRLRFELSQENLDDIEAASNEFNVLINDLEMTCFSYKGYGKEFIKSQKFSPDSYVQMAMQLAFYKIHGCLGATYETAATRQFLHGRTDVIRSASIEALDFCKSMSDASMSDHIRCTTLANAIDGHKQYAIEAVNGYGIDRHLFGLKQLAIENGYNIHELYLDAGYITSSHFRISSSQVSAKCDAVMFFGPLVPDGYGCCYNPRSNVINFGMSACNSSPDTFSGRFMETLEESLTQMHDLLTKSQKSKL